MPNLLFILVTNCLAVAYEIEIILLGGIATPSARSARCGLFLSIPLQPRCPVNFRGPCVRYDREPAKNGRTDRDAVWADSRTCTAQ